MRLLDKAPDAADRKHGDMWYVNVTWYAKPECPYWDNCDGKHLIVTLPNGVTHDCHARASNCTKPDDKLHRCWVVHGTPPNITIDKNGLTCGAGAGSIMNFGWHGFIRNGKFVEA